MYPRFFDSIRNVQGRPSVAGGKLKKKKTAKYAAYEHFFGLNAVRTFRERGRSFVQHPNFRQKQLGQTMGGQCSAKGISLDYLDA